MGSFRLLLVSCACLVACQQVELEHGEKSTKPILPPTPRCPDSPPYALERGKWVKVLDNSGYVTTPACIVGQY